MGSKKLKAVAVRGTLKVPVAERKRVAEEIAGELDGLIEPRPGIIVSLYWPFRGELDLRGWMRVAHQRGARIALPIVEAKGHQAFSGPPDFVVECVPAD